MAADNLRVLQAENRGANRSCNDSIGMLKVIEVVWPLATECDGKPGELLPTSGSDTTTILGALEALRAEGKTAGGEGLEQAYSLARHSFIDGGVNRVILATPNPGMRFAARSFAKSRRSSSAFEFIHAAPTSGLPSGAS